MKMEKTRIDKVAQIINGYAFDSKLFTNDEGYMPLIRIRDIQRGYTETFYKGNFPNEYIIHQGDYLIGMDGEFNISEWKGGEALLNQRVCRLNVISPDILPRYVYLAMPKALKRIEDETPFVTVKHLSSKKIKEIEIPLRSLPEQQSIVEELDCLTGIIEKQNEQLRQLDALAQSIFYDMFGDPIENEKGWNKVSVGDVVFDKRSILRAKTQINNDQTINYIDISSINNANQTISSTSQYSFIEAPSRAQQVVQQGDLLISLVRPNLKNIAVVNVSALNLVASTGFCVLRVKDIILQYLKQVVCTDSFTKFLVERTSGANYPAITEKDIKGCLIALPPLSLQEQFASKIEAIEREKELIKNSIKETEELFNSRMDYYFN